MFTPDDFWRQEQCHMVLIVPRFEGSCYVIYFQIALSNLLQQLLLKEQPRAGADRTAIAKFANNLLLHTFSYLFLYNLSYVNSWFN